MDADEDVLRALDLALDERDVRLAGELLAEGDGVEVAVGGREPDGDRALDELLGAPPVLDQVGDRDQLDVVALAELDQVGHARHRPVLVHHLADDSGGDQPGEPGEVDGRLGLAGSLEHAAGAGAERKDVARVDEIVRAPVRIDRGLDRPRAVGGRDPRRHALAGLDRDGECGLERRLVVLGHRAERELVARAPASGRGRSAHARAWP